MVNILKPLTSMERFLDAIRQAVEFTASNTTSETTIAASDIIQPVDIQAHYQQTIQTHTGVMVAPSGSNTSALIDTGGFDRVAVNLANDAATPSKIQFVWFADGVTQSGVDSIATTSEKWQAVELPTKARYLKVYAINSDAAPHTMNAWAFLKS